MKSKLLQYAIKSFNYAKVSGMVLRNEGRPLVSIFLRTLIPMGIRVTPSWVKVTVIVLRHINFIAAKQGLPGLVKYLKTSSVILQQYVGGHRTKDLTEIGPRIARNRDGLPIFIPVLHRRQIKARNPLIVRYYLTIFSLYRDIIIPGKLKISTITKPFSGVEQIFDELGVYIPKFTRLFANPTSSKAYVSQTQAPSWDPRRPFPTEWKDERASRCTDAIGTGFKPFPISKSSPLVQTLSSEMSTHPIVILRSMIVLTKTKDVGSALMTVLDRVDSHRSFARLWYKFFLKFKAAGLESSLPRNFLGKGYLGKLGLKLEAAGKMRVFAMVDPITQWSLEPLHKYLFKVLKRHSMDGTFDQLSPLRRAWRFKSLYSLDLSAATDRLPIKLQKALISDLLLDSEFANAWETLLVSRDYLVPQNKQTDLKSVRYAVGQPMGALSSWAMLAYTHHFIVQCAAWKCGAAPSRSLFRDYAVLGDDIVIFNKKVAYEYLRIINRLGVECGLAKSILSPKGLGLEFAKKTFLSGINVSPTPLKELWAALNSITSLKQYAKIHSLSFPNLIKLAGGGYKVLGGLDKPLYKQNNLIRMLKLIMSLPTSKEDLVELFSHLSMKMKRMGVSKYLDEFIRRYFSDFHKRVWKLNQSIDSIYESSKLDSSSPYLEEQQHFYDLVYGPYYKKMKKLLSEILREIEGIRISYHVGVWRLYQKTQLLEHRLASLSMDMLKLDKIEISQSPQAKQIRYWRQFGASLKGLQSLTNRRIDSDLTKGAFIPVDFIFGYGVASLKLVIPAVVKRILLRLPSVVHRMPVPAGQISKILWYTVIANIARWIFGKINQAMMPFYVIIGFVILLVGSLAIDGTDWMWETGVSPQSHSAMLGLINYYYGINQSVGSISWSPSWIQILFFILFMFVFTSGVLTYLHWEPVMFVIHNREERVIDLIVEGDWFNQLSSWQIGSLLTEFWLKVSRDILVYLWVQFLDTTFTIIADSILYLWYFIGFAPVVGLPIQIGFSYLLNLFLESGAYILSLFVYAPGVVAWCGSYIGTVILATIVWYYRDV